MLERYQDLKTENARIEKVRSHYRRFSYCFDSLPFFPLQFSLLPLLFSSSLSPLLFLTHTHTHTHHIMEEKQDALDKLTAKVQTLEEEVAGSEIKQEVRV